MNQIQTEQTEPEKPVFVSPPIPSLQVGPSLPHVMEPALFTPETREVQKARMALSKIAQEGPLLHKSGLTTLWTILSPALVVGILVGELILHSTPIALICAFLLATVVRLNQLESTNEQLKAAVTLRDADKSWLVPLIEALTWPDDRIQKVAAYLLTRLLPTITKEDGANLPVQHRRLLLEQLHFNADETLTGAILKAMEQIGDRQSLAVLEQMAEGTAWTPRAARLRKAARESLVVLETRLAEERKKELGITEETETQIEAAAPKRRVRSAQVEEQMNRLEEEKKKHTHAAMRMGFLVASYSIIVPYCGWQTFTNVLDHNWLTASLWGVGTLCGTQLGRLTLSSKMTEAVRELAKLDDIHAVGKLVEALDWPDSQAQMVAMSALTRLLPRMMSSDSDLLDNRQRTILYRQLKMTNARRHKEFLLSVLRALQQVGDQAAIPYVENLANASWYTPRQRQVKEEAENCLPYLQKNAKLNTDKAVLLRASSESVTTPELLLRPAGKTDTPAEQLLRPSEGTSLPESLP